jgi:hypothetical protein
MAEGASQSTCKDLFDTGFSDTITLVQPGQGSTVQIVPWGLTGQLNEENTMTTPAIESTTDDGSAGVARRCG